MTVSIKGVECEVLRFEHSTRGGGIEIDLSPLGYNGKMTAFQNYLGGGLLGRVVSDCNILKWEDSVKLVNAAEELRKHFHQITNPEGWESVSYEQNQKMNVSAY